MRLALYKKESEKGKREFWFLEERRLETVKGKSNRSRGKGMNKFRRQDCIWVLM